MLSIIKDDNYWGIKILLAGFVASIVAIFLSRIFPVYRILIVAVASVIIIYFLSLKIHKINWKLILIKHIASIFSILVFLYTYYKYSIGVKINLNAYYYTLSTISQSVAALVAFAGMFLVYRLQIMELKRVDLYKQLEKLAEKAKNEPHLPYADVPPYYNKLFHLYDLDNKKRIAELSLFFIELSKIDRIYVPNELKDLIENFEEIKKEIDKIEKNYSEKKGLIENPLMYSILTVMVSIFFLAFGEILCANRDLLNSLLIALGVVVTLMMYSTIKIFEILLRFLWSE
jgi:hypothetical protein